MAAGDDGSVPPASDDAPASADALHRRRMRGLFALGVRSIGGSERRVADLAGIDLRTIRAERTSPGLACVGRVGALLGLPTATACAIVAAREAPDSTAGKVDHGRDGAHRTRRRRDAVAFRAAGPWARDRSVEGRDAGADLVSRRAPERDPMLAALARADAYDDLAGLESLLETLRAALVDPRLDAFPGPARRTAPRREPRPTDLGLALCVSARLAAARGEMARVEPLLAVAARAGVPRPAAPVARRLVRQARADLALGAPWLACPHDLALSHERTGPAPRPAPDRIPTRFVPARLVHRPAGRGEFHHRSTVHPQSTQVDGWAHLPLARHALARLDREVSESAFGRRADRRTALRAAWCAATTGLLGVRILEIATHHGAARVGELATTLVVRAQLALESMLATAGDALRTLVLARAARLQLAEWALRMRTGDIGPADLEPPERAELAALLHRFPAARGAIANAVRDGARSIVRLDIGS